MEDNIQENEKKIFERTLPSKEFMDSLISVTLESPEKYRFVKETLTRIGIKSRNEKKLCQSCHILTKQGKYYLMHFKELFKLDGKKTDFTEEDIARRNMIAYLLEEWGLVKVDDPVKIESPRAELKDISIIPWKEKGDWKLESKYQIGKKKIRNNVHQS